MYEQRLKKEEGEDRILEEEDVQIQYYMKELIQFIDDLADLVCFCYNDT